MKKIYSTVILLFISFILFSQQPTPVLIKRLSQFQGYVLKDANPIYGGKVSCTLADNRIPNSIYTDSAELVYLEIDSVGNIITDNRFKTPFRTSVTSPMRYGHSCILTDNNEIISFYATSSGMYRYQYYFSHFDTEFNLIDTLVLNDSSGNAVRKNGEFFIEKEVPGYGFEILHLNKDFNLDSYFIKKIDSLQGINLSDYKLINDTLYAIGSNILGPSPTGTFYTYDFCAVVLPNDTLFTYYSSPTISSFYDFTVDLDGIINIYGKETNSISPAFNDPYKPKHIKLDKQMNLISDVDIDSSYYGHYIPIYYANSLGTPNCCSNPVDGLPGKSDTLTYSIYEMSTSYYGETDLRFFNDYYSTPYSIKDEHLGINGNEGFADYLLEHYLDLENLYIVITASTDNIPILLRFDIGLDRGYIPSPVKSSPRSTDIIQSIYPNPTSGISQLQFEDNISGSLTIINLSGRLVSSLSFSNKNNILIDLTYQPSGCYYYQIRTNNSKIFNGKIIKK